MVLFVFTKYSSNPKISDIGKMLYNGTMLNDNEYTEVEGRKYLNPNLVVDETSSFIDNLRQTQNANNAQIAEQTRMLGTDVPTNLGGLAGGNASSYWTSRYQTPQTNALVQDLRTAAQASALNQALENEQAMWKKRYQDAYRRYQKSAYDKANQPSTNTTDPKNIATEDSIKEITSVQTEGLAGSRYEALLMKYLQAGYPAAEAEARAKEDFGKSIDVDAPVEPYGGQ